MVVIIPRKVILKLYVPLVVLWDMGNVLHKILWASVSGGFWQGLCSNLAFPIPVLIDCLQCVHATKWSWEALGTRLVHIAPTFGWAYTCWYHWLCFSSYIQQPRRWTIRITGRERVSQNKRQPRWRPTKVGGSHGGSLRVDSPQTVAKNCH